MGSVGCVCVGSHSPSIFRLRVTETMHREARVGILTELFCY